MRYAFDMLGNALKPFFCSGLFLLKTFFSTKKKNCNIDYSSSLPYLIDVHWLSGFVFCAK